VVDFTTLSQRNVKQVIAIPLAIKLVPINSSLIVNLGTRLSLTHFAGGFTIE
jgi:hypothetical protein